MEYRSGHRRRRDPRRRHDLRGVAGNPDLRAADSRHLLRHDRCLGHHGVQPAQRGACLCLPVVHFGGPFLVPLVVHRRANVHLFRSRPRHRTVDHQLVVRSQCARAVVHALRTGGGLLPHSQNSRETDSQLLPVGSRLLVAGPVLQLGGRAPSDRRPHPPVAADRRDRREHRHGHSRSGRGGEPPPYGQRELSRGLEQPDLALCGLRGHVLHADQFIRIADGSSRGKRNHPTSPTSPWRTPTTACTPFLR